MLLADPNATIGAMLATAAGAIIFFVRRIFFSSKGRKMVKDGIDHLLEENKEVQGDPALIGLMARLMQQQENILQAMANERAGYSDRGIAAEKEKTEQMNRQWERIEDMTISIQQLAAGLNGAVRHFEQVHGELAKSVARVEGNQVGLATWIYQRMGGAGPWQQPTNLWPNQDQEKPPAQARRG